MQIAEGSRIRREIEIEGLDQPVQTEITSDGLSFWIKGNRKRVTVGWKKVVEAGVTGRDVPAFLMGKPLELLRYQITKNSKKNRETKPLST